jgi:hypothetical protein
LLVSDSLDRRITGLKIPDVELTVTGHVERVDRPADVRVDLGAVDRDLDSRAVGYGADLLTVEQTRLDHLRVDGYALDDGAGVAREIDRRVLATEQAIPGESVGRPAPVRRGLVSRAVWAL